MRAKHNTNIEAITYLGINHGTLMLLSMHVTHNANVDFIAYLDINHSTLMSLDAYKTQYKRLVYSVHRHQSWYPDVAQCV
jgi:hypothetical protein